MSGGDALAAGAETRAHDETASTGPALTAFLYGTDQAFYCDRIGREFALIQSTGNASRLLAASWGVLTLCWLTAGSLLADDPVSKTTKQRRYAQGPLRADEFRAKPNRQASGYALTMARVMFNYRFELQQLQDKKFEATLNAFESFSVFLPEESWWNYHSDETLLGHEQGHFDIAEIAARRVQLAFDRRMSDSKKVTATGSTAKAAQQELMKKLDKVMQIVNDQAVAENKEYDLRTRHGMRFNNQAEHRRIQLLTLERLGNSLKKSRRRAPQDTNWQLP